MNFISSILKNAATCKNLITQLPKMYHTLTLRSSVPLLPKLLAPPPIPMLVQSQGFKVRYKLQRRCKDCYLVVRNERTYVFCPTYPRHKQMSAIKKEKYKWKITHATQSKIRPY